MTRKLRCRFLALARCGGLAALLVACHLLAVIPLSAQVSAPYIRSGASNPAKCSAGVGLGELKLFYNVSDKKFVFCSDTDTWSGFAGLGANTFTDTQTMPGVILNGTGPFLLRGSEGTCGGATAGLDVLCLGDATGHGAMVSNNNDAFSRILRQADRFGSSPGALLVTKAAGADPTTNNCVKWLAGGGVGDAGAACGAVSPLPIANGGTNAATATAARQNLGVSYSLQAHEIENGNTWVASTTYYLGGRYGKGTVETYQDYSPIVKPGTLLGFCVTTGINGTHSDNATPITFYIRKNKATDSVATVTQTWNAAEVGTTCTTPYPLTANLMTFANGDAITVKITTPAWSTPPTNVYFSVTIEIQEDQ